MKRLAAITFALILLLVGLLSTRSQSSAWQQDTSPWIAVHVTEVRILNDRWREVRILNDKWRTELEPFEEEAEFQLLMIAEHQSGTTSSYSYPADPSKPLLVESGQTVELGEGGISIRAPRSAGTVPILLLGIDRDQAPAAFSIGASTLIGLVSKEALKKLLPKAIGDTTIWGVLVGEAAGIATDLVLEFLLENDEMGEAVLILTDDDSWSADGQPRELLSSNGAIRFTYEIRLAPPPTITVPRAVASSPTRTPTITDRSTSTPSRTPTGTLRTKLPTPTRLAPTARPILTPSRTPTGTLQPRLPTPTRLTLAARPISTPTPRPTTVPREAVRCTTDVDPEFTNVWSRAGGTAAGCPLQPAYTHRVAFQPFQNGFMLWRAGDTGDAGGMIYVIYSSGRWQEYPDQWVEGMPERAGNLPPAGLLEPKRGFGYLWQTRLGGPGAAIGWAVSDEQGSDFGRLQNFANNAVIFRFPGQGPIFLPDGKRWAR